MMQAKKIKCPHCGKETEYAPTNSFRPFCSERCKLIDLGQWADESYRVPSDEKVDIDQAQENKVNENYTED